MWPNCLDRGSGNLIRAASHYCLGFILRPCQAPFIYNLIFFYVFLSYKHFKSSSLTKKTYCKVLPSFHWEERKNNIVSCLKIYQEILEDKIKSEINRNLKQREESTCRAKAWSEPCHPSAEKNNGQRGLKGQEDPARGPVPWLRRGVSGCPFCLRVLFGIMLIFKTCSDSWFPMCFPGLFSPPFPEQWRQWWEVRSWERAYFK